MGRECFFSWVPCCESWLKFDFEVLRCRKKIKVKKNVWVVGFPVSWAPCCETWLKFEGEFAIVKRGGRKKMSSGVFIYWVRTHWLGAML